MTEGPLGIKRPLITSSVKVRVKVNIDGEFPDMEGRIATRQHIQDRLIKEDLISNENDTGVQFIKPETEAENYTIDVIVDTRNPEIKVESTNFFRNETLNVLENNGFLVVGTETFVIAG